MWFRFPEGVTSISVEQQAFGPEFTDKKTGQNWFRAPDHFAAKILDLQGFFAGEPPEGAPEDLPKEDPARDSAFGQMSGQIGNLQLENDNLKASLAEVSAERDDLKLKLYESEQRVTELAEQLSKRGETTDTDSKPKK